MRSAYYTYLEIIKHAYTLKFATFFEVHKAIIDNAPYQIDIDCYDDRILCNPSNDDLELNENQDDDSLKSLWNPSWRVFLVYAFNMRVDEVNDPRYAFRLKEFIQLLLKRFDNQRLAHQNKDDV